MTADTDLDLVPVDLEELAYAMEKAYRTERFLDMETGEILFFEPPGYRAVLRSAKAAVEDGREDALDWREQAALAREEDPERFVRIPQIETREAYRARERFARGIDDEDARADVLRALEGKGAFSRFQRALDRHEGLRDAWYEHKKAWHGEVARRWLEGVGVEPADPPPNP